MSTNLEGVVLADPIQPMFAFSYTALSNTSGYGGASNIRVAVPKAGWRQFGSKEVDIPATTAGFTFDAC